MAKAELYNAQQLTQAPRLTPAAFLKCNLLFVPTSDLYEKVSEALDDSIFFRAAPPRGVSRDRASVDLEEADLLPARKTLEEHLAPQIAECTGLGRFSSAEDVYFWCSLIDSRGYLNADVSEIASMLAVTPDVASRCIKSLRDYVEPAGLFASGPSECLLTQLERLGLRGGDSWQLIAEGADYLASGKLNKFAAIKGWDMERAHAALSVLRKLDPSPGRDFEEQHNIFPEVEFYEASGTLNVRLLLKNLPVIESCMENLQGGQPELMTDKWSRRPWARARDTVRLLGMRYRSILRTAIYIAKIQPGFITGSTNILRPLSYSAAAEFAGLSASTVFRLTHVTYALSRGRVLRMDSFFSRRLASHPETSVAELKAKITELNALGFNDRMISEKLSIPLRTISHHRNLLGLPPLRRGHSNLS